MIVYFDNRTIMEIFKKAETVRLRSYHDKYLLADEDSVNQDREKGGL